MRSWPLRLALSLALTLSLSSPVLATAAASSTTTAPYLEFQGATSYSSDTDFGVDWHIVFPDGIEPAGWSTYCSLDAAEESECTPESVNASTLTEGRHVMEITPRNLTTGEDGETYAWQLLIDVSPPEVVEQDDTLLARMGRDIVFPVPFRERQTSFWWDCSSVSATRHVYVSGDNVLPDGTAQVVLPSPRATSSFYDSFECSATNALGLRSQTDVWTVWDAQRPDVSVWPGVPRLMTGPLRFGMLAWDDETDSAGEPMRIFGQYRILTPKTTWLDWRTPDRWVTTRKASRTTGGWSRRFRLASVPRGHSVCVRAGARDAVGFRGVAKRACATRAWDDRDLRRSAGWSEARLRGAYRRTVLRTGRHGATLKLTRTSMGKAANILVRKCPRCGTIQLIGPDNPYWGFPKLEYSLKAKRRRWAKIPVHWGNRKYHGDYTIKVVSHGKPVVIDGLAVTPWAVPIKRMWTDRDQNS